LVASHASAGDLTINAYAVTDHVGGYFAGTRRFNSSPQFSTTLMEYWARIAFFIRKRPSGATSHDFAPVISR
jgi:hypothetical protein